MKDRIYVCHTYYHVYVTFLKEFALPKEEWGKATLVLSKMSSDFSGLKEKIEKENIFEEVVEFDEKMHTFFPELQKYREDKKNVVLNLINRMFFTKKYAKAQIPYIPVDFSKYKDIYVFCDLDPIGYYLNYKKIYYHAVEDGLNTLVHIDAARFDNRGNFKIKQFMAAHNLIFIQNGYSKYCLDMEVNQIEGIKYPIKKHKEVPRKPLEERLTDDEKGIITRVFVNDIDKILGNMDKENDKKANYIILTEPLCTLDVRENIFKDMVDMYKEKAHITIKPHPRDELDYKKLFPNVNVLEKLMPMEVLNFLEGQPFDKVISVLTETSGIRFAKEKEKLGPDFLDKYEDPSIHRQNETLS